MSKMRPLLCFFILMLAAIIMLLPWNPHTFFIGNDSGVFLYTAKIMQDGGVPYVDSWDHKGPFIYFIDLLGISIPPNPLWGLYILQCILTLSILGFFVRELQKNIPDTAILFGFALFLYAWPKTFGGVNQIEFYASLLLMLSFALLLRAYRTGRSLPFLFLGMTGAIVCLLRINNATFWVLLGLILLIDVFRTRKIKAEFILFICGLAIISLGTFVYLWKCGALGDFVDQYLRYNIFYSSLGLGLGEKIASIYHNHVYIFGRRYMLICACLLAMILIVHISRKKTHDIPEGYRRLLNMALLAYPLDLFLSGLSGRQYEHYLALLPVYIFLFGIEVIRIVLQYAHFSEQKSKVIWPINLVIFTAIYFVINHNAVMPWESSYTPWKEAWKEGNFFTTFPRSEITDYILETTEPDDKVLIWGGDTRHNFLSGRKSPTRYSYPFILMQCDYADEGRWWEFYNQLVADPPKLVIEMKTLTFPADWQVPESCAGTAEPIKKFYTWLWDNYTSEDCGLQDADDCFFRMDQ